MGELNYHSTGLKPLVTVITIIAVLFFSGCMTARQGALLGTEAVEGTERYVYSDFEVEMIGGPNQFNSEVSFQIKEKVFWEVEHRKKFQKVRTPDKLKNWIIGGSLVGLTFGAWIIANGYEESDQLHTPELASKISTWYTISQISGASFIGFIVTRIIQSEKVVEDEYLYSDEQTLELVSGERTFAGRDVTINTPAGSFEARSDSRGRVTFDLVQDAEMTTFINPKNAWIEFSFENERTPVDPIYLDARDWLAEYVRMDIKGEIYRQPNFNGDKISDFNGGDAFEVIGSQGNWRRVNTGSGAGWLFAGDGTSFWAVADQIDLSDLPAITLAKDPEQTETKDVNITSDVELNLPETDMSNPDAIAVVIGNRDYSGDIPNVDYAINDASLVKEYLIKTFGYKPGNIIYEENAGKATFDAIFGNESDHKGMLYNYVRPGVSDVFIYYSGHGAPDVNSKAAYLMPVDSNPSFVAFSGYNTNTLYENLAKLNARSVAVFLDACFSGAAGNGKMLINNASPIGIQVKNPAVSIDNSLIVSASSGDQISSWYPEMRHGLFTYFLLKAIKGEGDLNNNGALTLQELKQYLTDQNNGIPYFARRLHNRIQTPTFMSNNYKDEIVRY